ncbi:MAG TPA: TonB-dependent receptor [Blastocatellia bacterium]|nr:TonB-dependent receptor [Blastocatellia bacterium]HMX25279.1 TonB-dependent receptor [Blastocatellia bacterium]HMY71307.1 TonB-dependent receptor [Blastocatellia bacterium]HMZ19872.1 TonB-dependent receptor [Blastocatellia bacterium]HNG30263.1 TonB-dependent receptor [Blastocatellia bacterium]
MMRKAAAMLFLALLTLLSTTAAFGQAVYGNIVGTVTDQSGAAVPNAKVTITDTGRGVSVNTTTNESGNFTQRFLIVGRYQVRVEMQGFKASVQEVGVSVDQEVSLDIKLQPGAVSEEVTITAEAPLLKTERADVAITFSEKSLTTLPLLNRRFTSVELFTPGVTAWPGQTAASEDPQGSYRKIVNGQSFAGTSHLLDGTDNHDSMLGLIVINPTLESVTEAKVTTSAYDAEFGANAGVVSAQTRSGTNQFHAVAFEFLKNDHLNARNPFTQFNPIRGTNNRYIPVTQINQYGGAVSGKIIPNKLFWFGDYQGTRRNIGGSVITRVPTAAERAGDFSATGLPAIFDPAGTTAPAGRTQFQSGGKLNVIPTNRISQQAIALLNKYIPLPNFTPASADLPNYVGAGSAKFNEDLTNTRWDYYVTEKMHAFGRYSFADYRLISPGVYGSAGGGIGFQPNSTFAGESKTRNQSLASGFDYTISSQWLTDFRFGFYRYRVNVDPGQAQTTPAKDIGIPGLNNDSFTGGLPYFQINGVGGLAFGYALGVNACNCPLRENERQIQFVNNWTNLRGNHTIKFGADIRRAYNLRIPSDRHRAGELTFDAARTAGPSGGGTGLASFLLGDVSSFARYVSTITDAEERQNRWFFYGQDTWKVTKKLTLNFGIRDEIYRPQTVTGAGKGGFIDVDTGEVLVAGSQGVGLDLNQQGTFTTISPRLGIAYRVNDKTVVRLGYGRGFDIGVFGSVFGHNVTQNLPVLGIQSNVPASNYLSVFSLTQGPTALDPATILNSQPKGPNGRPILPNGVTAFILPKKLRLPTSDQWNLTVQRQLPWDISVEAAYVGSKGTHVFAGTGGDYDFNQATLVGYIGANGQVTSTNSRKPFFNKFGWSQNFRYYGSDASTNYHGGQFKIEKRFSKGLSLMSHYTWSRSFNFDGTYYNIDATQAYGPNPQTRSHVFLFTGIYEVPVGKGKRFLGSAPKAVDAVLGGWQINTVWQAQSGLPFTPTYRDCNADRDTGWCRPDLVGDWHVDNQSRDQWFRVTSAALTANGQTDGPWRRPQRGTFGSVGKNRLLGPGLSLWDVSFFKNFNITERVKAQFRAESYNFANHINLANPSGNGACVDCPGAAGKITSMLQSATPRQWQFALRLEY